MFKFVIYVIARGLCLFLYTCPGDQWYVAQKLLLFMMTSSDGNIFRVTGPLWGEFAAQPVTRSFDVFFDLSLNKRLSKASRRRWFETPSRSLWRHRNVTCFHFLYVPQNLLLLLRVLIAKDTEETGLFCQVIDVIVISINDENFNCLHNFHWWLLRRCYLVNKHKPALV